MDIALQPINLLVWLLWVPIVLSWAVLLVWCGRRAWALMRAVELNHAPEVIAATRRLLWSLGIWLAITFVGGGLITYAPRLSLDPPNRALDAKLKAVDEFEPVEIPPEQTRHRSEDDIRKRLDDSDSERTNTFRTLKD